MALLLKCTLLKAMKKQHVQIVYTQGGGPFLNLNTSRFSYFKHDTTHGHVISFVSAFRRVSWSREHEEATNGMFNRICRGHAFSTSVV